MSNADLALLSVVAGIGAVACAALGVQLWRRVVTAWRSLAFLDRCAEDVN